MEDAQTAAGPVGAEDGSGSDRSVCTLRVQSRSVSRRFWT